MLDFSAMLPAMHRIPSWTGTATQPGVWRRLWPIDDDKRDLEAQAAGTLIRFGGLEVYRRRAQDCVYTLWPAQLVAAARLLMSHPPPIAAKKNTRFGDTAHVETYTGDARRLGAKDHRASGPKEIAMPSNSIPQTGTRTGQQYDEERNTRSNQRRIMLDDTGSGDTQ